LGYMDWYSANEKCRSIGMRLPTLIELKAAYNVGITKSWQKDVVIYWSSTQVTWFPKVIMYYRFDASYGRDEYCCVSDEGGVRCHR